MLDLSTENKALCFEDSTRKPLYIFLYYWQGEHWKYFTTIENAIVLESAEITEGILEGNNFELGSFVVPSMKVQWQNTGIRYKDMVAVPVQKIGTQYIAYFDGIITKEELLNDGQIVNAELTSFLTQKWNIDVLPFLKEKSGGWLPKMINDTLETLGIINVNSNWLNRIRNSNYFITFNENTLPSTLTFNNFLKQLGEFFGCHIFAQEKRTISNLSDMETYQPSGMVNVDFVRMSNIDVPLKSNRENLPNRYKRLPYIQSTGTQYIVTDYVPNDNTSIEMQFYNFAKYKSPLDPYNPILNTTALFGSRTGQEQNSVACFLSANNLNEATFDFGNQRTLINKPVLRMRNFALKNGVASVDNTNQIFASNQSFSASVPMAIFSVNTNGEIDERCAIGKLYYFKVFENNVPKLNMIPCYDTINDINGLYDLISNKFYRSESGGNFIAPKPFGTFVVPYHINSFVDKTNKLSVGTIRVLTKSGEQTNYTINLKDKIDTVYEIKDNIFFEALSAQNWEECSKAVEDVGAYLSEQNLYYADLQTIYPPFIEGGDYLIVKSKTQSVLPSGYSALEYVEIKKETAPYLTGIVTNVLPNSNQIEIDIDFSFGSNESVIFEADAKDDNGNMLMLYQLGNSLLCDIGDYYLGETFSIPYAPKNQKLNLKLLCGNGRYEYKGSFSGNGTYNGDDVIYTKTNEIILGTAHGRNVDFKLCHFAYSQGGVKLCDMYPCMRESDGAIGVYDIVQNAFRVVEGNPNPNYESADIVVPVLSTTTKGIHSMRADILCKATNANKN